MKGIAMGQNLAVSVFHFLLLLPLSTRSCHSTPLAVFPFYGPLVPETDCSSWPRSRFWFQQVSEEAHIHFRDAGAIIEEALPPSPSSPSYDAYIEKEKLAGRAEDVVLDEKAALAKDLELEAAEVRVDETNGEDREERDGERGLADRERGGDDDDEEGDGGDGGFGDFQGGGGDGETGTGAVPIPNLLDTLKGIDGQGGLSMSYDSGVTEPEQHGTEGVDGEDGRADGGEEDWLGGLR